MAFRRFEIIECLTGPNSDVVKGRGDSIFVFVRRITIHHQAISKYAIDMVSVALIITTDLRLKSIKNMFDYLVR